MLWDKNCRTLLVSSSTNMFPIDVRNMTSEVWAMRKVNIVRGGDMPVPVPDCDNPAHFILCCDIWKDFPFRDRDPSSDADELGQPSATRVVKGDEVRNAVMLTRIFEPNLESGDTIARDGQV